MGDLLPRLTSGVSIAVLATGIGALVGWRFQSPVVGALIGAAFSAVLTILRDGRHLLAVLEWLRGAQDGPAPRDRGLWGELGYRIERALRHKDRAIQDERARLQQFLSAIEASPNGVLMLDVNDQIEWCNTVAADHFGIDPQRDRQQRITNLIRLPSFVAYLQAGQFGEPVELSMPQGRATLSVTVQTYGEGLKLLLSQDITERERNEAMRRDFVANVSHEIRTPLTVLSGFVETLASLPLTEAERGRVLVLMEQQTSRIQSLVDDLLVLAKLEGNPRPPADRWVAFDPLLAQAQGDARLLSAGRHRIEADIEPGFEVAGVAKELLSAVSNLLGNAVRYTPEGGLITLRWAVRDDGVGELSVRDNGIGIAREHLPRLTERFYRVDGSRSRETGGTGLGLSIVKHVVQRHSGELRIDSEPGQGSCFTLLLPAIRVRAAAREPASAPYVGTTPQAS